MNNARFDKLPDAEKVEYLVNLAGTMFGQERVRMLYDRLAPVIRDCAGHGADYDDPRENYWGGVWQIYRAE